AGNDGYRHVSVSWLGKAWHGVTFSSFVLIISISLLRCSAIKASFSALAILGRSNLNLSNVLIKSPLHGHIVLSKHTSLHLFLFLSQSFLVFSLLPLESFYFSTSLE
ncbi:hypothetical protein PENTCL1PPCAC_26099, partial [Pristionchus entomophagus]